MPLNYGSQIEEHHCVRQDAGVFDVSHMLIIDILGTGGRDFLRHILANDVDKIKQRGGAIYSCMLNHDAGIIDDCIAYFMDTDNYRVIFNAGAHESVMKWLNQQIEGFAVGLHVRQDLAMLAVQGPNAIEKSLNALPAEFKNDLPTLKPFNSLSHGHFFVARTGYTGEEGVEIILPAQQANQFWQTLLEQDIQPCGLGARDTLRLEAGYNLSGTDMDEHVNPLVSNLAWTIAWEPAERLFIGRATLELKKSQGIKRKFVGLVLQGKGIMRGGQIVNIEGVGEGVITSGSYSPTLECSIALARVPVDTKEECLVKIRKVWIPAKVIKPAFVRKGQKLFD